MFHTDRKLERRISEVKNHRYRGIIPMKEFAACEDEQGGVNPKVPEGIENPDKIQKGIAGRAGTATCGCSGI